MDHDDPRPATRRRNGPGLTARRHATMPVASGTFTPVTVPGAILLTGEDADLLTAEQRARIRQIADDNARSRAASELLAATTPI